VVFAKKQIKKTLAAASSLGKCKTKYLAPGVKVVRHPNLTVIRILQDFQLK